MPEQDLARVAPVVEVVAGAGGATIRKCRRVGGCEITADHRLGRFVKRPRTPEQHIPLVGANQRRLAQIALDDTGKPRPDLIPGSCMLRIGEHFRKGAEQYGERNYQKGIPQSRHLASLCRHLEQYKRGDTDEDHLAAFITNGIFMMFNEANFPDNPEIMDLKPERDA